MVKNERARNFLRSMKHKPKAELAMHIPQAATESLRMLERLIAFNPDKRPSAEVLLEDAFFDRVREPEFEYKASKVSRVDFSFEQSNPTSEQVRREIYLEMLEYHPRAKSHFYSSDPPATLEYPSGVPSVKCNFDVAERSENSGDGDKRGKLLPASSLPRASLSSVAIELGKPSGTSTKLGRSESIGTHQPEWKNLLSSTSTADPEQALTASGATTAR